MEEGGAGMGVNFIFFDASALLYNFIYMPLYFFAQVLRNQGFKVIMYLDDGMGGASDIGRAHLTSITVQNVLKSAGFLIAEES
jgi:hypothetical protein